MEIGTAIELTLARKDRPDLDVHATVFAEFDGVEWTFAVIKTSRKISYGEESMLHRMARSEMFEG